MKKALEITGHIMFDKKSISQRLQIADAMSAQGMEVDRKLILDSAGGNKIKFKFLMPKDIGRLNMLWSNFK